MTFSSPPDQPRIALLLGCDLPDPTFAHVDVLHLKKVLAKHAHFRVLTGLNLTVDGTRKAVTEFCYQLKQMYAIGLFYFAGHGESIGGMFFKQFNDVTYSLLQGKQKLVVSDGVVDLEQDILLPLRMSGNVANFIILDCCRSNSSSPSEYKDLNKVNVAGDNLAIAGMSLMFASESGYPSAYSKEGGCFTQALCAWLSSPSNAPGKKFSEMKRFLDCETRKMSNHRQIPSFRGPLQHEDFCFVNKTRRKKRINGYSLFRKSINQLPYFKRWIQKNNCTFTKGCSILWSHMDGNYKHKLSQRAKVINLGWSCL